MTRKPRPGLLFGGHALLAFALYAIHDALVKPMPGGDNTPSLAES